MKKIIVLLGCGLLLCGTVVADTQKVNSASYGVITQDATEITMPNGSKVMVGARNHAVLIGEDGDSFSQWCTGSTVTETSGQATGAGSCAAIADNGDVLWVWFLNAGPGSEGAWGVIGGTGQYAGASGGGKTQPGKLLGDGRSFTGTSTGKIKTK